MGLDGLDLERKKTIVMAKCSPKLMWVHHDLDMMNEISALQY